MSEPNYGVCEEQTDLLSSEFISKDRSEMMYVHNVVAFCVVRGDASETWEEGSGMWTLQLSLLVCIRR